MRLGQWLCRRCPDSVPVPPPASRWDRREFGFPPTRDSGALYVSRLRQRVVPLSYPTPALGVRREPGTRSIELRARDPAARSPWRNPSGDVRGPIVHQDPPPVAQVSAPVGRFHSVGVDVRKCELAHLARRVGALRRPIPKAGPKPVRDGIDAEPVQQLGQQPIRGCVNRPWEHLGGERRDLRQA